MRGVNDEQYHTPMKRQRPLTRRGDDPTQVIIPHYQTPQPSTTVVNMHFHMEQPKKRLGFFGWLIILILLAAVCDVYFNKAGFIKLGAGKAVEIYQQYVPTDTFEPLDLSAVVPGARVSSKYSPRRFHPIKHKYIAHRGVDLAAPEGTPIRAQHAGKITMARMNGNAGNTVDVSFNGNRDRYMHMHSYNVKVGQYVQVGQVIGKVGSTGNSTGPHLHLEHIRAGKHVNPQRKQKVVVVSCQMTYPYTKKILTEYVECVGTKNKLPSGFMSHLAQVESSWNPMATANPDDPDSAGGLYQIKPATAIELGITPSERYIIEKATPAAAKYLRKLLTPGVDSYILYGRYNQGFCGFKIIEQMAKSGTADYECGGRTHDPAFLHTKMVSNTHGLYQRNILNQGTLNRTAAALFLQYWKRKWNSQR